MYNPDAYSIGSTLYVASGGWETSQVSEYIVTKITPSKQIVAERTFQDGRVITIRLTPRGSIVGDRGWDRRSIVDAETAAELRRDAFRRQAWREVSIKAEEVAKAALSRDPERLSKAFAALDTARAALASAGGIT